MVVILIHSVVYFSDLLRYLILARIILSWLPIGGGAITRTIYNLTEPILYPIRNMIQKSPLGGPGMVLDFSPILAMLAINVARNVLVTFLSGLL